MKKKAFLLFILLTSCLPKPNSQVPGPDKQLTSTFYGALLGAGSGAVTGAQLTAGSGPGAWVGAGFGAASGMLQGLGQDLIEEDQLRLKQEKEALSKLVLVQQILSEHYERRLELYPNRDIFPADLFFDSDSDNLNEQGQLLAQELAKINKGRMPWSRFVITAYASSKDKDSSYALSLAKRRAHEIALEFLEQGVNPRRLMTQAVIMDGSLVIDPDDVSSRYRQAVEIVALDY